MECTFDKNSFFPNEIALAKVTLDNSKCETDMTNVTLNVEQEVTMHCDYHCFRETFVLAQDVEAGVKAGEAPKEKVLDVNLNDIKYAISGEKKKKGKTC